MNGLAWQPEFSPDFQKEYRKLCAKNAGFRRAVDAKAGQILRHPLHYKPLKSPLQGLRRVHVAGSFVIVFEPVEAKGVVRFLRLAHHDEAYGI